MDRRKGIDNNLIQQLTGVEGNALEKVVNNTKIKGGNWARDNEGKHTQNEDNAPFIMPHTKE